MDFAIKILAEDPSAFNDFRLSSLSGLSKGALWAVLFLCVLALFLSIRTLSSLTDAKRKATLISLRSIFIALIGLIILEPAITLENRLPLKGKIALLLDFSQSLSVEGSEPGKTRFSEAREWLKKQNAELSKLSEAFDIEAKAFGESLRDVSLAALIGEDSNLRPADEKTDIVGAIKDIMAEDIEGRLSGVVLITDGADSAHSQNALPEEKLLESIKRKPLPIYAVDVAAGAEFRDLSLTAVRADDFVYIRNTTTIEAEVTSYNYSGNAAVNLYAEGKVIAGDVVRVESGKTALAKLSFVPQRVGAFAYAVRVESVAGEITVENNVKHIIQKVIRDKIRLLHVSGAVSWDVRFLRSYLRSRQDIDLVSFYILRTIEDEAGIPNDQMALIQFPERELFLEQLHTFDVLIFQNFNYAPYNIAPYLENIRRLVQVNGGGFIMMGGDRGICLGDYARTPVEDVLPVDISFNCELDGQAFSPRVSSGAEEHPLLRAFGGRRGKLSAGETLSNLPVLSGVEKAVSLKHGSKRLLEHPFLFDRLGEPLPIIAVGDFGEGRTLLANTDALWRIAFGDSRKEGGQRIYNSFWNDALRYVTKDPETQNMRVSVSEETGTAKKPLSIQVRSTGRSDEHKDKKVILQVKELTGDSSVQENITLILDESGFAEASFTPQTPGVYRAEIAEEGAEALFKTIAESGETKDLMPRERFLKALAAAGGGSYAPLKEAALEDFKTKPRKLSRLLAEEHRPLWNNWIMLLIAAFFGGLEWFLRRRWGFL